MKHLSSHQAVLAIVYFRFVVSFCQRKNEPTHTPITSFEEVFGGQIVKERSSFLSFRVRGNRGFHPWFISLGTDGIWVIVQKDLLEKLKWKGRSIFPSPGIIIPHERKKKSRTTAPAGMMKHCAKFQKKKKPADTRRDIRNQNKWK